MKLYICQLGREALFISQKKTNATKKHQYERDLHNNYLLISQIKKWSLDPSFLLFDGSND